LSLNSRAYTPIKSNNEIENIPKWHFKNFTKLESMDLSRNRIERLAPGTFSENKNLKFLNLEKNSFKSLPMQVFRILGKRTSNVNFESEHNYGVNSTDILNLKIFKFSVKANLETLKIGANPIIEFDSWLFSPLRSLVSLGNLWL